MLQRAAAMSSYKSAELPNLVEAVFSIAAVLQALSDESTVGPQLVDDSHWLTNVVCVRSLKIRFRSK